ncbi:MAG: hypothetical protein M3238_08075 [Actinomycetota bacterium]|nr:hypothetical protein [Actinomycetota bacterium]
MRYLVLVTVVAALAAGCYGPDPDLTPEGKGLPRVTLGEVPSTVVSGSRHTVELSIENPGPAAMESVVVAFSRLGDPALPEPIVDVAPRGEPGPVQDVEPEPVAVSQDGVVYRFEGLAEGESLTIRFELLIPDVDGPAGNAVQVYDGSEPDRARGVRLKTEVEG